MLKVRVLSIVFGALFISCAGHFISKIDDVKVPQDVSENFKTDKFEVKELPPSQPTPAPSPSPSPSTLTSKKSKKKSKADALKADAPKPEGSKEVITPPNRRPAKDPLWIGEKLVYQVTYFGMPVGNLELTINPFKMMNNRKVYHVSGVVESSSVFNLVYKLHDTAETFFDYEGLFSYRLQVILNESKQYRNSIEMYDHEKAQSFFWSRWDHVTKGKSETKEYFPMTRWAQDSVSAIYYLRTLNWDGSPTHIIPIVAEGKGFDAVVQVVRKEVIDTPNGPKKTLVLKPETRFKGVMEKKGDSFIWITDDEHHYVVRIEAKVKIGTVVVNLKSVEPGTAP